MPSWFARLEEAWKAAATSSQRGVSGSWWDVHCKSAFTLKLSMQTWQMWEINLVRAFWTEYLKMYFGLWYFDVFFFFSLFEEQIYHLRTPPKTTNKPVDTSLVSRVAYIFARLEMRRYSWIWSCASIALLSWQQWSGEPLEGFKWLYSGVWS